MHVTVRGVSDWLWAKPFWLVAVLVLGNWQAAYGQGKYETPQQTNEKIQQLATLARAHPVDTPIGSGDLLHIDVFDVPELSRDVRVSDAGDISYPLIPVKIQASGQTPFQLEEKLEQLLISNGLVSHPQVSVFVKEQNSQPISIVGAVQHTMVYQVMRPTTLLEVLSAAGGITDDAGSVILITRTAPREAAKMEPTSATVGPPWWWLASDSDGESDDCSVLIGPHLGDLTRSFVPFPDWKVVVPGASCPSERQRPPSPRRRWTAAAMKPAR